MNLPYNPLYESLWTTFTGEDLSREAWQEFSKQEARRRAEACLDALIADTSTLPNYRAVCMVTASAHGYDSQTVVVQLRDRSFLAQSWTSLANQVSDISPIDLPLDLILELPRLRSDGMKLRSAENHNPDLQTGMEGRYGTLYLAVGTDAEWITFPRPRLNGRYPNTAVNRIYSVPHNMSNEIELVEPQGD